MNEKAPTITRWLRALTDLELAILYLLLGIYIGVATDAVVSFIWVEFVVFSLLAVGLLGVLRIITFAFALRAKSIKQFWARWAQLGLIALVLILIFGTNLDLTLRVWLSENALYKKVQQIQRLSVDKQKQMHQQYSLPTGFFEVGVHEVDPQSKTIWFHTADGQDPFGPFSLIGGIVYCEQDRPPERGETTYQHLYGSWWRWIQDM